MSQGRLQDQIAIVTGGTSGIGMAAARLFAKEGARVVATCRRAEAVDRAQKEMPDVELVVPCEVTSEAETRKLFERVRESYGTIDAVFLNAGILRVAGVAEMEESAFDEVVNVDLKGAWLGLKHAVPHLSEGGSIVINTSVANARGSAGLGAYAAAKAGVRALIRNAVVELAPRGIRVNAVSPGPTITPIFGKLGLSEEQAKASAEATVRLIPLGRMAAPEEIAYAALFLASKESSFVVGTELVVDGGLTQA